MEILSRVKSYIFLNKGHVRSINVKKNIIASFALKGVSIAITLLLVPIAINYLSAEKYGIWITLTSIVAWMNFFDIGLGNGFKNKLSEAIASGDDEKARIFVSTAYISIAAISLFIFTIFLFVNPWINWSSVLNCDKALNPELTKLAFIVVLGFCLRFVMQLIGVILTADQKTAANSLLEVSGNLLSFIGILFIMKYTKGSLFYLGAIFSIVPILTLGIASIYLFKTRFKKYRPSLYLFRINYVKEILTLGLQFFIIQIAALVLFQSNNILITQLLGPAKVTDYNVVFRYFGVLTMIMGIISAPMWAAYTEAYTRKDIDWIRGKINQFVKLMLPMGVVIIGMILAGQIIIKLWIGNKVLVSIYFLAVMGIYTFIALWNNIFSFFLNGISETKLQIRTSIIASIINIPLALFFVKVLKLNLTGIILANIISLSFFAILGSIFVFNLLKKFK